MFRFSRKLPIFIFVFLLFLPGFQPGFAFAASRPVNTDNKVQKYASIIVDADSLEILHARQIDAPRYPASLTKMMTLYMVFDALENGDLTLDEKLQVSANAANTAPVKLGLKKGQTITTNQAIQAVSVMSANDVAVVLAERIAGSEENFARMMSIRAKGLGMQRTIFKNANGLPDKRQFTTARDMAKLAHALLQNHGKYYHYFGQKSFSYKGKKYYNSNGLLASVKGVDGFKTGFTNASGYNLVVSAKREGRRLIAVVLGGASGKTRNQHMRDLIERGFKVQGKNNNYNFNKFTSLAGDEKPKIIRKTPPQKIKPFAATLRGSYQISKEGLRAKPVRITRGKSIIIPNKPPLDNWAVQIGSFADKNTARHAGLKLLSEFNFGEQIKDDKLQIKQIGKNGHIIYRARITGLSFEHANNSCARLAKMNKACLIIAP